MADDFLAWQNPSSTDERLDTESLTVGAFNVHRERVQIAGATATAITAVDQLGNVPTDTDFGVTTRSAIYGHTTAGGGAYVAVKVSPSGSLEVEPSGTVTVTGTTDGAILDGVSAAIKATVFDYTNSNPLAVRLTDTNGDFVSAGAGTQYTEGDVDATITGTAAMMEVAGNTLQPVQGTVADGLLVNLGANNDVTVTGSVTANAGTNLNTSALNLETTQTSVLTSVQLIDDIVYTDDTSTHSTGSSKGALIMAAATPTDAAVNANDIGAVAMTTDRKLHVSVQDALPAGTNNIGDVDVLTVPAPLSTTGGGTEATALRVTVATDSTGVLSVDDNGGSLTVDAAAGGIIIGDGTNPVVVVTDGADNLANTNNELVTAALNYAFDGTNWDRVTNSNGTAATAMRVVLPTDQSALTTAGVFSVKVDQTTVGTTNAISLAQLGANTVSTGNGASGTGVLRVAQVDNGTGVLATVTTVSTLTNQSQEGGVAISLNAGAVDAGTRRIVEANGAGKTILSKGGSAASSGDNTLVAAGTNKLKVFAFSLTTTSTSATTCIFQSGASGTELWRVILQAPTGANSGANLAVTPPAWLFATASATLLNLNLSAANTIHWSVSYYDEA